MYSELKNSMKLLTNRLSELEKQGEDTTYTETMIANLEEQLKDLECIVCQEAQRVDGEYCKLCGVL